MIIFLRRCAGIVKQWLCLWAECVCVDCQLFKQQHISSSRDCYNDSLLSWRKEPRSEFMCCPQPSDTYSSMCFTVTTQPNERLCLTSEFLRIFTPSAAAALHCRNLDQSLSNLSKSSKCSASLSALRRLTHYFWRRIWVKPPDFS